nr:hypothetical protein [uncultured Butyrivibrio sp.]
MESKEIRRLRADEIEVRVQSVNKGGVILLLYKDARVDQNILDETYGTFGWKRTHQMIGERLYCTVQVKNPDNGEWVEKQDVGTESYTEKEKGQASDSFKRACFNLGIGRELYTAPDLFYPKDKLASYKDGEKPTCYDKFRVKEITYTPNKTIATVTIECLQYGKVHSSIVFSNAVKVTSITQTQNSVPSQAQPNTQASAKTSSNTQSAQTSTAKTTGISDEEEILIGNCRGMKFKEAKNTQKFASFLNWVRTSSSRYDNPDQQRQFDAFKSMAKGA